MLAPAAPALQLSAEPTLSTDGVVQLRWAQDGRAVELQRAPDDAFASPKTLYRGTDSASVRTGLADGDYFYRVRYLSPAESAWSAPVAVTVRHHGPWRTWGLFGLGASVFLATLGLILWGARRERTHD